MDMKYALKKGIYAFKDTESNKIVYVGSTNSSFLERIGIHARDIRLNRHTNPMLTKLIESGNFEVVILESGEFNSMELLDREKYYTTLYRTFEDGYNINVGGCRDMSKHKRKGLKPYPHSKERAEIIAFIKQNYYNKRFMLIGRNAIVEYCNSKGYKDIKTSNFVYSIERFGFVVIRLVDKRSYLITSGNEVLDS